MKLKENATPAFHKHRLYKNFIKIIPAGEDTGRGAGILK